LKYGEKHRELFLFRPNPTQQNLEIFDPTRSNPTQPNPIHGPGMFVVIAGDLKVVTPAWQQSDEVR